MIKMSVDKLKSEIHRKNIVKRRALGEIFVECFGGHCNTRQ